MRSYFFTVGGCARACLVNRNDDEDGQDDEDDGEGGPFGFKLRWSLSRRSLRIRR